MWKRISVVLIAMLLLLSAGEAYAAARHVSDGMARKVSSGVVNTFTGWVEFPAQIIKGYNEGFMGKGDNKILGAVTGIFSGIGHAAGRTISGVIDLVTFWAANPEDNENIGIPLDGEYVWEEGKPYNLFEPSFSDATMIPIGNKFLRGAGNALFGFVELPGQILKGIGEGAPDLGIIKGLWFWYSREVNGLADIATLLLPSPRDQKGVAFDEEWPWGALVETMQ